MVASLLFVLMAIPAAIFALKRLARYRKGKPIVSPATLFLLGSFFFLTANFIDHQTLPVSTVDILLHDTIFVIAHIHIMIFFMLIFLAFSIIYFFYPSLTGASLNAPMGYIHFGITIVGAYLFCWQFHYISLEDMPRRYIDYDTNTLRFVKMDIFKMSVIILLLGAQLVFLVNLAYSLFTIYLAKSRHSPDDGQG
jgi:cytochrome c oxidase subunit 1